MQHDLKDGAHQPRRRLGDEHHVRHQRKSLQLQLRDVRLQQHVHLQIYTHTHLLTSSTRELDCETDALTY